MPLIGNSSGVFRPSQSTNAWTLLAEMRSITPRRSVQSSLPGRLLLLNAAATRAVSFTRSPRLIIFDPWRIFHCSPCALAAKLGEFLSFKWPYVSSISLIDSTAADRRLISTRRHCRTASPARRKGSALHPMQRKKPVRQRPDRPFYWRRCLHPNRFNLWLGARWRWRLPLWRKDAIPVASRARRSRASSQPISSHSPSIQPFTEPARSRDRLPLHRGIARLSRPAARVRSLSQVHRLLRSRFIIRDCPARRRRSDWGPNGRAAPP